MICILMIIAGCVLMFWSMSLEFRRKSGSSIIGCLGGIIFSIGVFEGCYYTDEPTALDVYQGKTTLEITYKDSVAIDTVVVFKDKK